MNLSILKTVRNINPRKSSTLEQKYRNAYTIPSDINEHITTLYKYALRCSHITECGVRTVVSSYAFAYALKNVKNNKLVQVDLEKHDNIIDFQTECRTENVNTIFYKASDLECPIEQTELLFIDTWHVYGQLKRELMRWHNNVSKYIILHDTTVDGELGETLRLGGDSYKQHIETGIPIDEINKGLWPAIEEFLNEYPEWTIKDKFTNNNGLTVLQRKPKVCFISANYGSYELTCKKFIPQTIPTDFICFTDGNNIVSNGWDIVSHPYHKTHKSDIYSDDYLNSYSNNKHTFNIAKYYKQSFINIPILKDYDIIIWIDGTIELTNPNISMYVLENTSEVMIWEHEWRRGNLYSEALDSINPRYTSTHWNNQDQPYQDVLKQYQLYLDEGYDESRFKEYGREHMGVWVTCFIGWNMKSPDVHRFLDKWYEQTLKVSTQEQMSFSYVVQKLNIIPHNLPDDNVHGRHALNTFYIKHNHGR
jgi:hypothetical protein